MKRFVIGVAVLFMFVTLGFAVERVAPATKAPAQTQPQGQVQQPVTPQPLSVCCNIGGTYSGLSQDISCTGGNKPQKGEFKMVINQAGKCGGTFQGEFTNKDGKQILNGQVTPGGPKGCCLIDGKSATSQFKGTMCKKGTKWEAKGEFKATKCQGTWEMIQN